MVEFEDSFSERMAQLEQEELERYQRDVLKNTCYSYDDETPNSDEFQSKLIVLMDLVRGYINDFKRAPSSTENGSEPPIMDLHSELGSETTDELNSDEELVVNELQYSAEMLDIDDSKGNDSLNLEEMPNTVSESGLKALSIYCAHMAPKWKHVLDSQPLQGNVISVEVYFDQFYDWKKQLEAVSYIGDEQSYIDDFLWGLNRDLRLRVCEYNWKPQTLYEAFCRAVIEETMMKKDADMVLEEMPQLRAGSGMGNRLEKGVFNSELLKADNLSLDALFGIGMASSWVQSSAAFGKDRNLLGQVLNGPLCMVGTDIWKAYGYCSRDHLNLTMFGEMVHFNFDPGGMLKNGQNKADEKRRQSKDFAFGPLARNAHTKHNCSNGTWGGFVCSPTVECLALKSVFPMTVLQVALGSLGDTTVNSTSKGSAKAWLDRATLIIEVVLGANALKKYASIMVDVMPPTFRANVNEQLIYNYTRAKQNIGSEGLGKWDQSMLNCKDAAMEMTFGETVMFMFDPGISSVFDEMVKSFQGAEQEMYVFGFKGVPSSRKHANSFTHTWERLGLFVSSFVLNDWGLAGLSSHNNEALFCFYPGGCSLPQMAHDHFIYSREHGDYCLTTIRFNTGVKAIIHVIRIKIACVCGIEGLFDRALSENRGHVNVQCIGAVHVRIRDHSVWRRSFDPGGLLHQMEGQNVMLNVPNNGSTKAWIEESTSGFYIVSSQNENFYVEHKLLDERFQSIVAALTDEQGISLANECYWDNKMFLLDPGGRARSLKVWSLRSYFIFYCGGFLDKNSWKVITNNVATFLVDFNYKLDDGFGLKMILTFIIDPGGSFWHSVCCDSISFVRMNAEAVVVKYQYGAGDISSKHGSVKALQWGKVVGGSNSNTVRCPFMEQGKVTDPNMSQYIAILLNEHNVTVNDLIETFCAMKREETLLFLHLLKHGVDNRLLSLEMLDVRGDEITLSKCWSFLLYLSGNSFALRTWNLRKELYLSWDRLFTNTGQYIDYIVEFEAPAAPRLYFLVIDSWRRRTIFGHATYVCSFFMRGAIAIYLPSYALSALSFVLVIVQLEVFFIFVWDPGLYVISFYILEDKDFFKRVGKKILAMVMISNIKDEVFCQIMIWKSFPILKMSMKVESDKQHLGFWFDDKVPCICQKSTLVLALFPVSCDYYSMLQCHIKMQRQAARSAPKLQGKFKTAAILLLFSIISGISRFMSCALLPYANALDGWLCIYKFNESTAISKMLYGIPVFVFQPP